MFELFCAPLSVIACCHSCYLCDLLSFSLYPTPPSPTSCSHLEPSTGPAYLLNNANGGGGGSALGTLFIALAFICIRQTGSLPPAC